MSEERINSQSAGLSVGDRLEVLIENVAYGGHFIARHNGEVIFVRHAITGERVLIQVTAKSSKVTRADAIEVISASPYRVAAPCKYAKPGACGGCDFQHIDIDYQRDLKRQVIVEQFRRIGGITLSQDFSVQGVDPRDGLHWRTRMDFAITKKGHLGLFGQRSNDVIEIEDCLIADEGMNISEIAQKRWNGKERVEVAISNNPTKVELNISRAGRSISGPTRLNEKVLGRDYNLSSSSFWQSHKAAPATLVKKALELLELREGDHVCDLYGGVGLFAAAMADQIGSTGLIHLIELDKRATADAQKMFSHDPRISVKIGRVESVLKKIAEADVLLLDPPRTGAGEEVVAEMLRLAPRTIVYVSCDPGTLARDSKELIAGGYAISHIVGFDLFPMTSHVECVVQFTRGE